MENVDKDVKLSEVKHHLAENANDAHKANLSNIEKACAWVCEKTGSPNSLIAVVVIQVIWVILGEIYKFDPYPFAFLLTVSNIIQLILIFVLAVGQNQTTKSTETRAEIDHKSISIILHHQDLQEQMLGAIMKELQIETDEIKNKLESLNKK